MRFLRPLAALAAAFVFIAPAAAEPTEVKVRVIAKGAKFVGTTMGGARVVLRDAATGEILAQGVTAGSTGETGRIMTDKLDRYESRWTPGAAEFSATLDIDEPVKVRVEATGPLGQPQASATVTAEQWVAPGLSVTGGDAWLLELPGVAVDILAPAAHSAASGAIEIEANAVLMCGCPLTPGGTWDADDYVVRALIWRNGEKADEIDLEYAGEASRFAAAYTPKGAGAYRIVVVVHNPKDGNTGLDETTVRVN